MSMTATAGASIYTQTGRTLAIETTLGPDALLLTDVEGDEGLSDVFLYNAVFVTQLPAHKINTLLGQPVTMWLQNDTQLYRRPINGCIRRLTLLTSRLRGFETYRAEIVPRLWFLDCTADCRIFQNLTAPEIIRTVLDEHDLTQFEFRLVKSDYPRLDYCVQYRESALAFVSRLMERFGIFYCHQHEADRHLLVMLDSNLLTSFAEPRMLGLSVGSSAGDIACLQTDAVFRPGRWTMTDYDFEAPSKVMRKEVKTVLAIPRMDQHEIYDYPGGYTRQKDGEWLTHLRMEAEEAQHLRVMGKGLVATMDAGRRLQIVTDTEMTVSDRRTYLLTEVRHRARERSYFTAASGEVSHYENEFVAIPDRTQFRPRRVTPAPVIAGLQTATVISPDKGDPVFTDMYGRVKLHFHWDRRGDPHKDETSCWVRVSQASAGSQWGGVSVPHAGQEVVVAFLEGDPDRPLVVGRVHNAEKMPPLTLPADKHKAIVRDQGDNKLIMHGKAGKQWMSMVSPRSLNMVAMPEAARPLSAGAYTDIPGSFDSYDDQDAFTQLTYAYNELKGNTLPQTPNSVAAPKTGNDDKAGDFTATDGININTLSGGEINSLSIGKTNNWVGSNANTWVKGDSHTYVKGEMTSVCDTFVSNVAPTQHDAIGGHVEETLLHLEETLIHIEMNNIHFDFNTGAHLDFHNGGHVDTHNGQHIENHIGIHLDMKDGHVEQAEDISKIYATKTEVADQLAVVAGEVKHITARDHVWQVGTFKVQAGAVNMKGVDVDIGGLTSCKISCPLGVKIN